MTVLHLIPRDTRTELWIAAVLVVATFAGCVAFGLTAGTTAEVAFGSGTVLGALGMGLFAVLLGNPERFWGIGE